MLSEARQFNFYYLFFSFGLIALFACKTKEVQTKPEMFEEVLIYEEKPVDQPSGVNSYKSRTNENEKIDFDFIPIVLVKNIGKEIVSGDEKEAQYFTNYLGRIKIGQIYFHVVTQYIEIQCAIHKRGRSRIIFLKSPTEITKVYKEMQGDDLPIAIKGNQLVYKFNDKEVYQSLGDELLEGICIPENRGCY
jgi:hypothetical protein